MGSPRRERVSDLPPSAKLVYTTLEHHGSMTQKQIVDESMLSPRTVRYALERLEERSVVDEEIYFADARQNLYSLTPEATATDGGADEACCAE